jgi:acyl-CoA thioesterase YciA
MAHTSRSQIPQIRIVMMPKDTNYLGHIFGGVILSHLDLAASEHAKRVSPQRFVTKIVREVDFITPVLVGDTVSYYTQTVRKGVTSITVRVQVEVERGIDTRQSIKVTEAEVIMVAVDEKGKPQPLKR